MLMLSRQVECRAYSSDEVPSVWETVKPLIQKALDRGAGFPIEEIRDGLADKSMQLWTAEDDQIRAAIVTTIQTTEHGGKGCLLLACGGSHVDEWLGEFLSLVEPWAKSLGCKEMRIYGRIGWSRMTGYKVKYTKMTKSLED